MQWYRCTGLSLFLTARNLNGFSQGMRFARFYRKIAYGPHEIVLWLFLYAFNPSNTETCFNNISTSITTEWLLQCKRLTRVVIPSGRYNFYLYQVTNFNFQQIRADYILHSLFCLLVVSMVLDGQIDRRAEKQRHYII
jgi:hypothetical protein